MENVDLRDSNQHDTDTIIGTNGPNVLVGGPERSRILGRGGADVLRGGPGGDTLTGGGGYDAAWGGQGRDVCRSVKRRHGC